MCWSPSWRRKYCRSCEIEKHRASALLSQNTKKLQILLNTEWLSISGFKRFIGYTDNIIRNWKVLMKYKTADSFKDMIVVNYYGNNQLVSKTK